MKILVIGAHPDDEILGCGGTIIKYIEQGHEVHILICTKAYPSYVDGWTEEYCKNQPIRQAAVDKFVGITKRHNFDIPTLHLNNVGHGEISLNINKIVGEIKPDIVFTHNFNDMNLDHFFIAKSTEVACRPEPKRSGFRWKIKLYAYEIIGSTPNNFSPNYYEILGKNHIKKKLDAFKLYTEEAKSFRRTPEIIERLSKKRADEILVNYAEAFKLIREVN